LETKIVELLNEDIPEVFKKKSKGVLFRQVATPNYETRRFISIIDGFENLDPLFFEYYQDKFTSNNEHKHSLGKIRFFYGHGKNGGAKIERVKIIDFNFYNGKKISDVKTLWGENLTSFHKKFFNKTYRKLDKDNFFEASKWFTKHGPSANKYYLDFLLLFIRHSILFDNFLLDKKELGFSKEIFLPAFIEVYKKTGFKPIVVALGAGRLAVAARVLRVVPALAGTRGCRCDEGPRRGGLRAPC
jgi:hypothetical protein